MIFAPIPADERRVMLYLWMISEHESGAATQQGMTAEEIVDVIGHPYDKVGHYRYSRCFDDLLALAKEDAVVRLPGRPARWTI